MSEEEFLRCGFLVEFEKEELVTESTQITEKTVDDLLSIAKPIIGYLEKLLEKINKQKEFDNGNFF